MDDQSGNQSAGDTGAGGAQSSQSQTSGKEPETLPSTSQLQVRSGLRELETKERRNK